MVRRLRAAARHWGQRGLSCAWVAWREHAARSATRQRGVTARLRNRRLDLLRDAWLAWGLERIRGVRERLTAAADLRLRGGSQRALDRWRVALRTRRDDLEAALVCAQVFRRWMLLAQTAVLSRLLLRGDRHSFNP